jgi:peptidoglycan/xylan/chitin deacetylase (PgdA/CDA1 family)
MRKKTRVKRSLVVVIIIIALILLVGGGLLILSKNNKIEHRKDKNIMIKLNTLEEVNSFSKDKNIKVNISYEYDDNIEKDKVISQSIKEGDSIKDVTSIDVVVSLGKLDKDKLASDGINELGKVPIMMYHGIREKTSNSTGTVGGNVDKDGYNRTPEAFREDLEFYYENGYEMIRLDDYINGIVKASYGKSPIILTFDDGNEDNIKVTGLDDKGNIIIDKNSAVGILEEFKKKHPDTNVTATFFVNGGIFNQSEYNDKILKWMVENGYDIGNHTQTHLDIKKSSGDRVQKEIAYVYDKLEKVIPGKYVKIIALPFGSPYVKTHDNFKYVLSTSYNGKTYETEAALRVGWEPEVSCFDKDFDKTFLKRCRAYDNNGKEFDIDMVFNMLKKSKYISDGNPDTIVIKEENKNKLGTTDKKVITY